MDRNCTRCDYKKHMDTTQHCYMQQLPPPDNVCIHFEPLPHALGCSCVLCVSTRKRIATPR